MADDSEPFDKRRARTRRPCPIWIDKFLRDTMHLQADEVGAYFLILGAMWMRLDCDFPDDDRRLAQVSRISLRLWKARVGPTIRAFFSVENGALVSKRLRIEAGLTEEFCEAQSNRKRGYAKPQVTHNDDVENGEKSAKPLKSNKVVSSVDSSPDNPGHHPTQHTQHKKDEDEDARAREANPHDRKSGYLPDDAWLLYDLVLKAVGYGDAKMIPAHWMPPAAVIDVIRWRGLALNDDEIVEAAREHRKNYPDPPKRPSALEFAMNRYAAVKAAPKPSPPDPAKFLANGDPHENARRARQAEIDRLNRIIDGAVRGST